MLALNTAENNYFGDCFPQNIAGKALVSDIHHYVHGKRSPYIVKMFLDKKTGKAEKFCARTSQINTLLQYQGGEDVKDANIYFSINSFRKKSKNSEDLFAINALYIDIDCHGQSGKELETTLERTKVALCEVWDAGVLPVPTRITETGRGFGLFYILDRSIPNTKATEKMRKKFRFTYDMLLRGYQQSIHVQGSEVDTSVSDVSRIVRLPGTVNRNVGKVCQLSTFNGGFYDLGELGEQVQKWYIPASDYIKEKVEREVNEGQIIKFATKSTAKLQQNRIEFFRRYQSDLNRRGCPDGTREILAFLFYNAVSQIQNKETARNMTSSFNADFLYPLSENTLKNEVFRGVDGCRTESYKLTNAKIMEKLGLTAEAASELGFGVCHKTELKKITKNNENEIDEIIKSFVENGLTRDELLEAVNKALLEKGLAKRNGKPLTIGKRKLFSKLRELELSRFQKNSAQKSAKNFPCIVIVQKEKTESELEINNIERLKKLMIFMNFVEQTILNIINVFSTVFENCKEKDKGKAFETLLDWYEGTVDRKNFIFDFDYFFKSVQIGKIALTYKGQLIPKKDWDTFNPTEPQPVEIKNEKHEADIDFLNNKNTTWGQSRWDCFVQWLREKSVADVYDGLVALSINNTEIHNIVSTLPNARKDKHLEAFLTSLCGKKLTCSAVLEAFGKAYPTLSASAPVFKRRKQNLTDEQRQSRKIRYQKVTWMLNSKEAEAQKYRRVVSLLKANAGGSSLVGSHWTPNKEILQKLNGLSVEQLRKADFNLEKSDLLREWMAM